MKPGYITTTRRQTNNQWSGGIAAHPAPKYSQCKNPLEIFSPRLFGIKTTSSSLTISQRAKLTTRSVTHLCWCKWRTFWRKFAAGSSARESCSCMTLPRLTGYLQPRRNGISWLPASWSPTLFSASGPVGLPPVPWTEKTIERSSFFIRRVGHCCRGDLFGRTNF